MLWGRSQDSGLLLHLGCPWMGGHSLTCAHLGTGLMHLACPEHLSRCLLLLPPLALQHLEKGAGGPCWGAGDLQAWQSSGDTSHPHCLPPHPQQAAPQPLPSVPDKGLDTRMEPRPHPTGGVSVPSWSHLVARGIPQPAAPAGLSAAGPQPSSAQGGQLQPAAPSAALGSPSDVPQPLAQGPRMWLRSSWPAPSPAWPAAGLPASLLWRCLGEKQALSRGHGGPPTQGRPSAWPRVGADGMSKAGVQLPTTAGIPRHRPGTKCQVWGGIGGNVREGGPQSSIPVRRATWQRDTQQQERQAVPLQHPLDDPGQAASVRWGVAGSRCPEYGARDTPGEGLGWNPCVRQAEPRPVAARGWVGHSGNKPTSPGSGGTPLAPSRGLLLVCQGPSCFTSGYQTPPQPRSRHRGGARGDVAQPQCRGAAAVRTAWGRAQWPHRVPGS